MTKDKIFHQQVIDDNPFPNEEGEVPFNVTQSTGGERVSAEKIPDQGFPTKRIATEVISTALNTKSRKILAEFEFTESGALQIGKYANGVSGDLKISPSGIVARNDAGTTTFAIDGTTGDAVFKGTVQAGSLITGIIQSDSVISGDITVGGDGNNKGKISVLDASDTEAILIDKDGIVINDGKITIKNEDETTIIDEQGLISTANFLTDSAGSVDSGTTSTTSTSLVDVPNCIITAFSINRPKMILTALQAEMGFKSTGSGHLIGAEMYIYIGGEVAGEQEVRMSLRGDTFTLPDNTRVQTLSTQNLRLLPAASPPVSYVVKARWRALTATDTAHARNRQIAYFVFGN